MVVVSILQISFIRSTKFTNIQNFLWIFSWIDVEFGKMSKAIVMWTVLTSVLLFSFGSCSHMSSLPWKLFFLYFMQLF
jgi:hypothetical protein